MKITIRPAMDPERELDVTHCVVAAVAEELWRRYGGNDRLNWLEAERSLGRVIEGLTPLARECESVPETRSSPRPAPDPEDVRPRQALAPRRWLGRFPPELAAAED